ncbi:MAG: hypothetical protein R3E79_45290 [Caldilineaceae bacterium]
MLNIRLTNVLDWVAMSASPIKFAQLLSEGVHRVRLHEGTSVQIVQDELGYTLGRAGGSAIEHWRKGHIPSRLAEVEALARELVRRGRLDQHWLEQFLRSAGHRSAAALCTELFGAEAQPQPQQADGATGLPRLAPFVVGPPVTHRVNFWTDDRSQAHLQLMETAPSAKCGGDWP